MQPGVPQEVFWTAVCIGATIGILISLTIQFFFLWTVNRTLKEVAESNREISTGAVWATLVLNLIPVVGSIWSIYVVSRVTASVRKEFEARGWETANEGFGRVPGLLWAWGGLLYQPVNVLQLYFQFNGDMGTASLLSVLGLPVGLGMLVCFILFWVYTYQYGTKLKEGRRDGLEDDYDDRYRRPRGDDEPLDWRDEGRDRRRGADIRDEDWPRPPAPPDDDRGGRPRRDDE
jgi:hypothetical protein